MARPRKVMSPPMPSDLPTPVSSSASSFRTSSRVFTPFPNIYQHTSSSSLSSLSLAFPNLKAKTSPRLQAAGGTVYSSTANARGSYLLQPRREGRISGLFFASEEKKAPEKKDDEAVRFTSPDICAHEANLV